MGNSLEKKRDNGDKDSRWNCLLLHLVKEQKNENNNIIVLYVLRDQLHINLSNNRFRSVP